MDKAQQSNVSWWSSNPMTYDWGKQIQAEEGSPEFFRQCDQRALAAHRPFGHPSYPDEKPYSRLIDWEKVNGKKTLEIGCGMGLHASLFAKEGAAMTTMDLTWRAARLVRQRFNQEKIAANVVRGDGERLPYRDASFDRVWSWGVIHHSAHTDKIVPEIHRVLKPGGTLQVMVYHRSSVRYWIIGGIQHGILRGKLLSKNLVEVNQTFTDGSIARHYTRDELKRLLGDFKEVHFRVLQEAGSEAFPKISPFLRKAAPSLASHFDRWINGRWGWFLFAEAIKKG